MILHEKDNQIYIIFTYKRSILFRNPKFPEIADGSNSGTKYARDMKVVSNVYFWILYCIPLITQFRPKVDLGPFGNELFKYKILTFMWI